VWFFTQLLFRLEMMVTGLKSVEEHVNGVAVALPVRVGLPLNVAVAVRLAVTVCVCDRSKAGHEGKVNWFVC